MTKINQFSTTSLMKLLDKTRDEATKSFNTSTEQRLQQLSNCLSALDALLAADLSVRKDFRERLTKTDKNSTTATPLATKIVRYVFQTDRRRCATYSLVLRAAKKNNIDALALPAWVSKKGGIESIRRTTKDGKTPSQIDAEYVEIAKTRLSDSCSLVAPTKLPATLQPSNQVPHSFSIAILHKQNDGKSAIVFGLDDERLIKLALARAGKRIKIEADQAATSSADAARKKAVKAASDAIARA